MLLVSAPQGICYHITGLADSNPSRLKKAVQCYGMAMEVVEKYSADENADGNVRILMALLVRATLHFAVVNTTNALPLLTPGDLLLFVPHHNRTIWGTFMHSLWKPRISSNAFVL
jgi:hypothetical protein